MATANDREAFERALPDLLANSDNIDKYALLHGGRIDSIWPTLDEAIHQGYERFDVRSFLVRRIVENEEPIYCSHSVSPCQ